MKSFKSLLKIFFLQNTDEKGVNFITQKKAYVLLNCNLAYIKKWQKK